MMRFILFFLLLNGYASGFAIVQMENRQELLLLPKTPEPFLGWNRDLFQRSPFAGIIGGSIVPRGTRPYQVYLEMTGKPAGYGSSCGGTVLDSLHILTAAHCVRNTNNPFVLTTVTVYMRMYSISPLDASAIAQTVNVNSNNLRVHQQWNQKENDIAILTLNSPINFTSQYCNPAPCVRVSPVTLPVKNSKPVYDNRVATAVGFGRTSANNTSPSPIMKQAQLTVLSASACQAQTGRPSLPSRLCATQTSSNGVCSGDSGGPLLIGNTQIGITSYAFGKCTIQSGFTRLSYYVDNGWIANNTLTPTKFNYCSLGANNTLCRFTPSTVGPSCQKFQSVQTSAVDQQYFLNRFNSYRAYMAQGKEAQMAYGGVLPPASNMRALNWDDELAAGAQAWAQQCTCDSYQCTQDANRLTQRFNSSVGQLSYSVFFGPFDNVNQVWSDAFIDWYSNVGNMKPSYVASLPSDPTIMKKIGKYTQLVWAGTYAVGCGFASFAKNSTINNLKTYNVLTVICNFGPSGNVAGSPVYLQGNPGSACPVGTTSLFGLCY